MVRHILLKLSPTKGFLGLLRETILTSSEDDVLGLLKSEARRRRQLGLLDLAGLLDSAPQGLYRVGLEANLDETPALARVCEVVQHFTFEELDTLGDNIAQNLVQFLKPSATLTCVPILVDFPYEPGGGKLGGDVLCAFPDGSVSPLNQASGIIKGVNDSFNGYLRRLRVLIHPALMPRREETEKRAALQHGIQHYLISVV